MRIFIGLTEVSGYYAGLKSGFDAIGLDAFFVSLQEHRFRYDESEDLPLIYRFARYCVAQRVKNIQKTPSKGILPWTILVLVSRLLLFFWAIFKFDVFLLGGGSSFFRFAEFPILKLLRKRIIYTFHGTDSRPSYIDGFSQDISKIEETGVGETLINNYQTIADRKKTNVERVEKYADVIINAPPQAQFHMRPYIIGLVVGLPLKQNSILKKTPDDNKSESVRILHSPSHIEGKGTVKIRKAIQSLKTKGYPIDYVEISGQPNSVVLEEISKADFVVDQLYSDSPMAGFCAEAALFSKPAVVGGYYSRHIRDDLKPEWIPPSLYCHPDDIEKAIEKLIMNEKFRCQLGKNAHEFVKNNWNAKIVAERYLKLINDDYPRVWLYNPKHNKYIHGMGMPEAKAKIIIRSIVEKRGKQALLLNNHPELVQRLVDFAFKEDTKC